METYYGTKRIEAQEMPGNQNKRDGYAVQYSDGYVSWSPKEAFEKAYRKSGDLNFGHALEALKEGKFVCRSGWNGKGLKLRIYEPSPSDTFNQPHVFIFNPGSGWASWVPSQTDQLAEDWCIVD